MRDTYRVVAIDARGHGDSDAPDAPEGYVWDFFVSDLAGVATQLLAETGQPQIAYGIGNSFGGIVTAAAEARHPGLFGRIAMLDPPIHPPPALIQQLGLDIPDAPVPTMRGAQARRRTAVWPSRTTVRSAWQDKPMFSTWVSRAFDLYLEEGFRDRPDGTVELKCSPEVEATIFDTTGSLDSFDVAPAVQAPVLLARARDGFIPAAVFEYLAGRYPNCRLEAVDSGHLMPLEAPELTARTLLRFANGH